MLNHLEVNGLMLNQFEEEGLTLNYLADGLIIKP